MRPLAPEFWPCAAAQGDTLNARPLREGLLGEVPCFCGATIWWAAGLPESLFSVVGSEPVAGEEKGAGSGVGAGSQVWLTL